MNDCLPVGGAAASNKKQMSRGKWGFHLHFPSEQRPCILLTMWKHRIPANWIWNSCNSNDSNWISSYFLNSTCVLDSFLFFCNSHTLSCNLCFLDKVTVSHCSSCGITQKVSFMVCKPKRLNIICVFVCMTSGKGGWQDGLSYTSLHSHFNKRQGMVAWVFI